MDKHSKIISKRYDRVAKVYDLLEKPMEMGKFKDWRKRVWDKVSDYLPQGSRVLEVGVGTGKNIPYYPEDVQIYAIDFSREMLEKAKQKVKVTDLNVKLSLMDIQDLDFPDNFFDAIVATCVFCSVPDPIRGFQELHRVCKPDGKIFLLEHVRSERPLLGALMDLFNPLTVKIWGANINRHTLETIGMIEFADVLVTDLHGDIVKEIIIKNSKKDEN